MLRRFLILITHSYDTNDTTSYKKIYLPVVDVRMQLENIHFEHFVEAVVVVQSEMSNVIAKT